jgi:heterodisulfide reductase subunit C
LIKKPKILQYNSTFLKDLLKDVRIPKDLGLKKCIQCGNCSSACPAARYTSYRPRKFIHDILTGQKDKIFESEELWYCYSCFSCNLRCPRSNNPGILIHIIRDLARQSGYGWKNVVPFKNFLVSLMGFGLCLTPFSQPIELFEEELGPFWVKMRQNLPEILNQLSMNPVPPRELPQEARDQIKKILELAEINKELEQFTKMEKEYIK